MKIIKNGINLNPTINDIKIKRQKCYNCLCKFKPNKDDITKLELINKEYEKYIKYYFDCPYCKTKLYSTYIIYYDL